jgi:hypothetical protein
MFIPKGTQVFVGIWAMHQNEKMYPDRDSFNPDRFLNHPKLANEYAVGPDYNNRDKYPPSNILLVLLADLLRVHTIMHTELAVACAPAFI